jgi:8-oxo-dGTP diphosphatase
MPKTRVGAYGVCLDGDRILLSRYLGGEWALPGGGIDFGEDPYDGVIREVKEETGYLVAVEALLGVGSVVWQQSETHMISIIYHVTVVGGELAHEVDGSSDQAAWIEVAALPELPHVSRVDEGLELLRASKITPS